MTYLGSTVLIYWNKLNCGKWNSISNKPMVVLLLMIQTQHWQHSTNYLKPVDVKMQCAKYLPRKCQYFQIYFKPINSTKKSIILWWSQIMLAASVRTHKGSIYVQIRLLGWGNNDLRLYKCNYTATYHLFLISKHILALNINIFFIFRSSGLWNWEYRRLLWRLCTMW